MSTTDRVASVKGRLVSVMGLLASVRGGSLERVDAGETVGLMNDVSKEEVSSPSPKCKERTEGDGRKRDESYE